MDCQFCKNSRVILYRERMDVKMPCQLKSRPVEVLDRIESHVYCIFYSKIVSTKIDKNYCEMERGVFDDMPELD